MPELRIATTVCEEEEVIFDALTLLIRVASEG